MKAQESHNEVNNQFEVIKTSHLHDQESAVQSGEFVPPQQQTVGIEYIMKRDLPRQKEPTDTSGSGSNAASAQKPNPFGGNKAKQTGPTSQNSQGMSARRPTASHIAQFTQNKEQQMQQMKLVNDRISQQQKNIGLLKVQGFANQIHAPRVGSDSRNEAAAVRAEATKKKELKVQFGARQPPTPQSADWPQPSTNNVSLVVGAQADLPILQDTEEETEIFRSSNEIVNLTHGISPPAKSTRGNDLTQSGRELGATPVPMPDPGHLKFLYEARDSPSPTKDSHPGFRETAIEENRPPMGVVCSVPPGAAPAYAATNETQQQWGFQMGLVQELQNNLNIQLQMPEQQAALLQSQPIDPDRKAAWEWKKPSNIPKPTSGITDPTIVKKLKIHQDLTAITNVQSRSSNARQSRSQGQARSPHPQLLAKKHVQKLHEQAIVNNILHNIQIINTEVSKRDGSKKDSPEFRVARLQQHSPTDQFQGRKYSGHPESISLGGDQISSAAGGSPLKRLSAKLGQTSVVTKESLEDELQRSSPDQADGQAEFAPKAWSQTKRFNFDNNKHSLLYMHPQIDDGPLNNIHESVIERAKKEVDEDNQASTISPSQLPGTKTLQNSSACNTQIKNILRTSFVDTVQSVDIKATTNVYGVPSGAPQDTAMKPQVNNRSGIIRRDTQPTEYQQNATIQEDVNTNLEQDVQKISPVGAQTSLGYSAPPGTPGEAQRPDLMNNWHLANQQQKPQTAGNNCRKRNLQANVFVQQNNMINLQQMIQSQQPWGLDLYSDATKTPVSCTGPTDLTLSTTQAGKRNSLQTNSTRKNKPGFKTPVGQGHGQFFKTTEGQQMHLRRRNISTQQQGRRPINNDFNSARDQNKLGFGNSFISSKTGFTGNTGQPLTSMMERPENSELSQMQHTFVEPVFSNKFLNSFQFIEQLEPREIKQKMYSRDGSVNGKEGVAFCIKQQKEDRMIRTNKSHNLRTKNNQTQLNRNMKPLNCNYIANRFRMNENQYEKCMGRRMTYMENQWIKEKRLKSIINFNQQVPNPNEIILIQASYQQNLNGQATHMQSNRDLPNFHQPPVEIPQQRHGLKVDVEAAEKDAQNYIPVSPGTANLMDQSKKEILIGRVYSNHNSFLDDSVDRETANLSPMAYTDPLQKSQQHVNQAKIIMKKADGGLNNLQNVLSSSTQGANIPVQVKYEPQSQQKTRQPSKTYLVNTGTGIDRPPPKTPTSSFLQRRRGTEVPQSRPSATHSLDKNIKDETQTSVKFSEMDVLNLQQLDTSLYNLNTNQHRIFEDFLAQTQRSIIYEPIQSKIQKMNYNGLDLQKLPNADQHLIQDKSPTEIQQILNAHRAKMASRQQEVKQQSELSRNQNSALVQNRANTNMDHKSGSVQNTHSFNEKLSKNTSNAGDFTKIKMHKVMQSNFSQMQSAEKKKPLWNVNKNPKSKVINYKTQTGHQLSKLSTGDPYKKLNQLVQKCMQNSGKSRQRSQDQDRKRAIGEQNENLEIDSEAITNYNVRSQRQFKSPRVDGEADDSRAIYGMKELKVPVNPRFLSQLQQKGDQKLRGRTDLRNSPAKQGEDFDDLNLHKNQNQPSPVVPHTPNRTINSSMGMSPAIKIRNEDDNRGSSMKGYENPTIPTVSAMQEGEVDNTSDTKHGGRSLGRNKQTLLDVLQDAMPNDQIKGGAKEIHRDGAHGGRGGESHIKSSQKQILCEDTKQKYNEVQLNSNNVKLPIKNSIIAKSIQNTTDHEKLKERFPEHQTLRPTVVSEKNVQDQDIGGQLSQKPASYDNEQMSQSHWQSFGGNKSGQAASKVAQDSVQSVKNLKSNEQIAMKNLKQTILFQDGNPNKTIDSPSKLQSTTQMLTIPGIGDDGKSGQVRTEGKSGMLSGQIQPNLTLTPHSGFQTNQSNSPRSKASSKIVFQRNRSPKSINRMKNRGKDQQKNLEKIHDMKTNQKSVDPAPSSPEIQFQVIKEIEPVTTERPREQNKEIIECGYSAETKSKDLMNRSLNEMQLLNNMYGTKDKETYESQGPKCTTSRDQSRVNVAGQSIEDYSKIDIQINKGQNADSIEQVSRGVAKPSGSNGKVVKVTQLGEHTNLESREDVKKSYQPRVMVRAKNSSSMNDDPKTSQVSNVRKSYDSQEIKDVKFYMSPKTTAFQEMQHINRTAFNIAKMSVQPKRNKKAPWDNARNRRAGASPEPVAAPSVTIHQSVSSTNARGRQSDFPADQSPVSDSRHPERASFPQNQKSYDGSYDEGGQVLKPQPITQTNEFAPGEGTEFRQAEDTKTHQTIPLSPTSNATETALKEDMCQQTSFIDKMSRDLTGRSPLGGGALTQEKSSQLQEQHQDQFLEQVAKRIVNQSSRQPIHHNPPSYLKKENMGTKYKFEIAKGGRRNRDLKCLSSNQQATTHYGKSMISSTYRSRSRDGESDFVSREAGKGGLKPLGIVKESLNDTSREVTIKASNQQSLMQDDPFVNKRLVNVKARDFYDNQVLNVRCHRGKRLVEIQVDPQYRVDSQENSIIHVVDAFGEQHSTMKQSDKYGNDSLVLSSQRDAIREKQSARINAVGLLPEHVGFSMTQQTATNYVSQSSRGDDDIRSNDTKFIKADYEQLQKKQGYFKGISFTDDIKAQLVQECINNNQIQWQDLAAKGASQVGVKDRSKSRQSRAQRHALSKSDCRKGLARNLAGLVGKGVVEQNAEHLQNLNQQKNIETTVQKLWGSRLINKQAQAIADALALQERQSSQEVQDKVVVLVSSPVKEQTKERQQPQPQSKSASAAHQSRDTNIFSSAFNVQALLSQEEYKSHLRLQRLQAGDRSKLNATDDCTPAQHQSVIKLTETAADKITLDSEAVRELLLNHEHQDNAYLSVADVEAFQRYQQERQVIQTASLNQTPAYHPVSQLESSRMVSDPQTKLGERNLFVLPTSEVADLYKELKERDEVNQRDFGLVGRQPVIYQANIVSKKTDNAEKQKENFAKINATRNEKCERLMKLENQTMLLKGGHTNLVLTPVKRDEPLMAGRLPDSTGLGDHALIHEFAYHGATQSQAGETHRTEQSKKEEFSPRSSHGGKMQSQVSIREKISAPSQDKKDHEVNTITTTMKPEIVSVKQHD